MQRFLFLFIFSIQFNISLANIDIDRLDLDESYKIIENIIKNPDKLISYKMLNETNQKLGLERITKASYKMINLIKNEFDGEYRYVYSNLYRYIPFEEDSLNKNDIAFKYHTLDIQLNSLKNGRKITFRFDNKNSHWTLYNIDLEEIWGGPNIHRDPFEIQGQKTGLKLEDNCKLYNEDNYKKIIKLLSNKDSLFYLLIGYFQEQNLRSRLYNSKEVFVELVDMILDGTKVSNDEIFEADSTLQKDDITILNRISLVGSKKEKKYPIIAFHFMKKNGVWMSYDIVLEKYPDLP